VRLFKTQKITENNLNRSLPAWAGQFRCLIGRNAVNRIKLIFLLFSEIYPVLNIFVVNLDMNNKQGNHVSMREIEYYLSKQMRIT